MHLNANTWHFAQDLHLANGLKHVAVSGDDSAAPMMQLLLVYVCKKFSVTGWRFINLLRDTTLRTVARRAMASAARGRPARQVFAFQCNAHCKNLSLPHALFPSLVVQIEGIDRTYGVVRVHSLVSAAWELQPGAGLSGLVIHA